MILPEAEPLAANVTQQLTAAIGKLQSELTGRSPTSVSVLLGEDTLVLTIQGALSPAETELAKTAAGAARVEEFHRQLFASSATAFEAEISRITGRPVRNASLGLEPRSGSSLHAFASGTVIQVFLLGNQPPQLSGLDQSSVESAEDEGLKINTPGKSGRPAKEEGILPC